MQKYFFGRLSTGWPSHGRIVAFCATHLPQRQRIEFRLADARTIRKINVLDVVAPHVVLPGDGDFILRAVADDKFTRLRAQQAHVTAVYRGVELDAVDAGGVCNTWVGRVALGEGVEAIAAGEGVGVTAEATLQQVIAGTAVEGVAACTGVQGVIALVARE